MPQSPPRATAHFSIGAGSGKAAEAVSETQSETQSKKSPEEGSLLDPKPPTRSKAEAVLEVKGLTKTFVLGLFRKKVEAVRGVDFAVEKGEIFGILGPNGAGKTTTIKAVLGLIFPTSGSVRLFGKESPGPDEMRRLGYLPENPYVYQYLKAHEFLDLCGRLCGMDQKTRKRRADEMIAKVGLTHAVDRPIGRFSKGMTQRIGLAQALLHDPELIILDEPMSGLDPIGRKEVRDLILEERAQGKTVVFTSHILSDVEMLCDRVAIVAQGKVTAYGALSELLRPEVRRTELELENASDALNGELASIPGCTTVRRAERLLVRVEGETGAAPVLRLALAHEARVVQVHEQRETLEDLFLRDALKGERALKGEKPLEKAESAEKGA
jgi:ABC-2 type transport system ATP-binding protein